MGEIKLKIPLGYALYAEKVSKMIMLLADIELTKKEFKFMMYLLSAGPGVLSSRKKRAMLCKNLKLPTSSVSIYRRKLIDLNILISTIDGNIVFNKYFVPPATGYHINLQFTIVDSKTISLNNLNT